MAEFFAGIGLARLGLEAAGAEVIWANDIDQDKAQMYRGQFGDGEDDHLVVKDVARVTAGELPAGIDLIWGSFPCTDLSRGL